MTCEKVSIELPFHLRGELDAVTELSVTEHLRGCETCRHDLVDLETTLQLIGSSAAVPPAHMRTDVLSAVEASHLGPLLEHVVVPPPPELRRRVLAAVEREGADPTSVAVFSPRRARLPRLLATAALILAGVVGGYTLADSLNRDETNGVTAIPEGHETQVVALSGMGPPNASVRHYRHDNFRITLSVRGFEVTPVGSHYAVWVRGPEGDVPIGTFRLKHADDFDIPFAVGVNPSKYPEFVVTMEPNDGDPRLTGEVVTEGRFDLGTIHHGTYDD